MNNSKNFLESKIKEESNIVHKIQSSSEISRNYLVHKKKDEWFCNCKSFQVRKECKHIKKVTEPIGEGEVCFNCGTTSYIAKGLDKNHVERRSTNPESKMNASNIMILCRSCHSRTTNDSSFEENLKKIWRLKNN